MIRAVLVSLKHLTKHKQDKLSHILSCYRAAVNFYLRALWEKPIAKLNKENLALLKNTRLTERYKSNALRQAISIIVSTKKSLKATKRYIKNIPVFNGYPALDKKFVDITSSSLKSFDMVMRVSTLTSGLSRKPKYLISG